MLFEKKAWKKIASMTKILNGLCGTTFGFHDFCFFHFWNCRTSCEEWTIPNRWMKLERVKNDHCHSCNSNRETNFLLFFLLLLWKRRLCPLRNKKCCFHTISIAWNSTSFNSMRQAFLFSTSKTNATIILCVFRIISFLFRSTVRLV